MRAFFDGLLREIEFSCIEERAGMSRRGRNEIKKVVVNLDC